MTNTSIKKWKTTLFNEKIVDPKEATQWISTLLYSPLNDNIPLWCVCALLFCDIGHESESVPNVLVTLKDKIRQSDNEFGKLPTADEVTTYVTTRAKKLKETDIPSELKSWWGSLIPVLQGIGYTDVASALTLTRETPNSECGGAGSATKGKKKRV